MPESYERQTALKLKIKEIKEGDYILEEEWKPNYLLTKTGKKVFRVNLVGVVLDKETQGTLTDLILDDGSGKIRLRSFEEIKNFPEIQIGDCLLVIGKIRFFNNEKYISPEILKKIDKGWLQLRAREGEKATLEKETPAETLIQKETPDLARQKILELIRELDRGEGVLIEDIKEKFSPSEELLEKMLESGELYQNLPGRVKVL